MRARSGSFARGLLGIQDAEACEEGGHEVVLPAAEALARVAPRTYDPAERARQKQASREQDARDLASGAKSRAELHRENAHFSSLRVRIHFGRAKSLA